jgi:glycosyltransferase involved in cell wall biosynthesis
LSILGIILKKLFKVAWVADYRDPWTHNAHYDPKYHYVDRTNRYMELKSHLHADKVIANTPGNRQKIIDDFRIDGNKVVTITNGYDEDDFRGIDSYRDGFDNDRFNIVYTGTFYDGYAPDTFFRALNNLLADGKVKREECYFHMAGFLDIKDKDRIFALIKHLGLDDVVEFHGGLGHRASNVLMMRADLLLLILPTGKGSDSWVPGKLYEYLRCSRPILALIPEKSDCGDIIKSAHAGFIAPPGDVEKIEEEIVRCYTLWKQKKLTIKPVQEKVELYERRRLTGQLAGVLDSVVGARSR